MKSLLLEIGAEEIPAGYIEPALDALSSHLLNKLDKARIAHGPAKTFGTPRRLVLYAPQLEDRQEDVSREVVGPPKNIAFDAGGRPTKAALVFAEKNGTKPLIVGILISSKQQLLHFW